MSRARSAAAVTVALALGPSLLPAQQERPAEVTIPLNRYEALKRAGEGPSLTVVDTVRFGGSFKGQDLSVAFEGRASNRMPTAPVLDGGGSIVIHGCEGEGIVARGEGTAFALTPLAERFRVRCRIATKGSDRLELTATPAVLWIESAVADGEFVAGRDSGAGQSFSIVRRTAAPAEGLPATATGRYRVSLRPDETRFRYEIAVRNPNRSRRRFELRLASGEIVQQVDARSGYDAKAGLYRFELPPGDHSIVLSGALPGSELTAPLDASVQYLLLESHPLLRTAVPGEVKRVSPGEVGLDAEFRGAQAFLLSGRQKLAWTVSRLEALRTTSFALTGARHVFFLPADGPVLGESSFAIDNQGAPDLSLPMSAEPTYASLQGEAVLLTKDAEGHLWLPLSQGSQSLLVQHRQAFRRWPGGAFASLALPQVGVPASVASVELRYPADWVPLYESFLGEAQAWAPDGGMTLGFLLLFVGTERVGFLLGLALRRRLLLAAAAALAGLADGTALTLLLLADLAVAGLWLAARLRGKNLGLVLGVTVAVGLFLMVFAAVIPSLMRARVSPRTDYAPPAAMAPPEAPAPTRAPQSGPEQAAGAPATQAPAAQYQGLPARYQLPSGAWSTHFSREMLGTDAPRFARAFMVSRGLVAAFQIALVVLAAVLVWRGRREIAAGFRARLEAARAGAA